jgi:hypothetical protein
MECERVKAMLICSEIVGARSFFKIIKTPLNPYKL